MAWDFLRRWSAQKTERQAEAARRQAQQRGQQRAQWTDAAAIEAEVKAIVAAKLKWDVRAVSLETNCYEEDDSVGNAEIIMLCEENFGIDMPDEDAEYLLTVADIVAYVQQQLEVGPATLKSNDIN